MEEYSDHLIFDELQTDDDIFEGIIQRYSLNNISLVVEETDILDGRVIFSECEYLSFV